MNIIIGETSQFALKSKLYYFLFFIFYHRNCMLRLYNRPLQCRVSCTRRFYFRLFERICHTQKSDSNLLWRCANIMALLPHSDPLLNNTYRLLPIYKIHNKCSASCCISNPFHYSMFIWRYPYQ